MTIETVAVITVQPGKGDEAEVGLRALAVASHAEEGCLLYALQRGLQEPDTFVTVERWASQEALEQHLASPHLAEALGTFGPLLAAPPHIIPTAMLDLGGAKGSY